MNRYPALPGTVLAVFLLILVCPSQPRCQAIPLPRAIRLEVEVVDMPLGMWENLKETAVQRGRPGSLSGDRVKWLGKEIARKKAEISLLSSSSTVCSLNTVSELLIGRQPGYTGSYVQAAHGPLPAREKLLLGMWGLFRLDALTQREDSVEALLSCQLALVEPQQDPTGKSRFLRRVTTPGGPLEVPCLRGLHSLLSIQIRDGETRVLAACSSPFSNPEKRTSLVLLTAVFLDEAEHPLTTSLKSSDGRTPAKEFSPEKSSLSDEQRQNLLLDPSVRRNKNLFIPGIYSDPGAAPVLISGKVLRLPEELLDYVMKRYTNEKGELDERGRKFLGRAVRQNAGAIVNSFDFFSHPGTFFRLVYGREHGYLARHHVYRFEGTEGPAYSVVPAGATVLEGTQITGGLLPHLDNQLIMDLEYTPEVVVRETEHTWGESLGKPAAIIMEQPEMVRMKMSLRCPVNYNTTIITQDLGVHEVGNAADQDASLEKYVFLIRLEK